MPDRRDLTETVILTRRIYDGRVCALREDTVRLADGRTAKREIVEHDDVVAIVAADGENRVLLVRQYRLAAQAVLLEVPAGMVDKGEDLEAAAQRELREETGYRADRLQRLTGFFVSPGFCTEFVHVFLASGLIEDPMAADEDEDIEVVHVPFEEALELVRRGEIKDGKSIVGLLLAAEMLGAPVERHRQR